MQKHLIKLQLNKAQTKEVKNYAIKCSPQMQVPKVNNFISMVILHEMFFVSHVIYNPSNKIVHLKNQLMYNAIIKSFANANRLMLEYFKT